MNKLILLTLILFLVSPVFAGDKIYTEDDLDNYRYPTESKSTEIPMNESDKYSDRINYFDITDIDVEITKLNEKIQESKKSERNEVSRRCISTAVIPPSRPDGEATFIDNPASEAACQETIESKYERYREKLSQQISILKDRQQKLKVLYEIQEQRERMKY